MSNYYYITEQNEKTQEQLSKYDYDKKKINEDIFDWKLNNMSNKGLNVGLFGKIPNLECNINSRPVNTGKNKSNKKICDRIFKQYNDNTNIPLERLNNSNIETKEQIYNNHYNHNNISYKEMPSNNIDRINTIDTKNPNNYL